MERSWPTEALDFGAAVRGALSRAGGVGLTRRCEANPTLRELELRPVLESLGLFDLEIAAGEAEAAAAALAVHAAGSFASPWPLVQQLSAPRRDLGAVYLCDGPLARAAHLDVAGDAAAVDVTTGEARRLILTGPCSRMPLDPFGVPCEPGDGASALDGAIECYVVLLAFYVVGALGSARDLAARHARERHQFGRRIADFGGTQWHLSDIAVAHDGLWELAAFSLARLIDGQLTRADTLALYLTTLESAHAVLAHAHQVLAAIGLCEEHDLALLTRHLQAFLRRPCGVTRVLGLLAEEIAGSGFDSLYPLVR
jgi:hypothetical protein